MSAGYKFYLFPIGADMAGHKSLEVPLMMCDAINFSTHFIAAVNQSTEHVHQLRSAEDLLGFQQQLEKLTAWKDKPVKEDAHKIKLSETSDGMWYRENGRSTASAIKLLSLEQVVNCDYKAGRVVINENGETVQVLETLEDAKHYLAGLGIETFEVEEAPASAIEKAVDAPHYKGYIDELQWIDALSKIPSLRKPERFIAALEMQIRKYMDRNGQKDDTLQEWKKARFYMVYLVAYMENGNNCVPASEIHERMKGL